MKALDATGNCGGHLTLNSEVCFQGPPSTQNQSVSSAALYVFLSLAIILDDTLYFRTTDLGNPLKNQDGVQCMAIKYVMLVYEPLFLTFTLSYLGPFVFTRILLPLLESTAANGDDARIVNVSLLVPWRRPSIDPPYRSDPMVIKTLPTWIMVLRELGIVFYDCQ